MDGISPNSLSFRAKFCYGVGHILNDLCASMWFTYLLVYLHKVVKFSNLAAGALLLIGQVADAIATPIVGIESDRTHNCAYGRRKIWHLIGVLCVTLTFPFIFNLCITCENSSTWALFVYYTPFIIIFQFGWASTQISHLSLIPELTSDEHAKTTLNTIRYGCTVTSNIFVFCVAWFLFETVGAKDTDNLSQKDAPAFMYLVFVLVGTGLVFMVIFHAGVKEPHRTCTYALASCKKSKRSASNWTSWFREHQFYQVGLLYMCTRLIVNITQVYLPMYLISSLELSKSTIAIMPLIVFSSGFVATFLAKPTIHYLGRKGTHLIGLIIILGVSVWFWFLTPNTSQIYGTSVFLGIGGSLLLVTALTLTADLIGNNKETGAFVYGAMSFVDKLSNGIAVQLIQALHPCRDE
ncbi:predicted protein [Nematostella vectensis]|uniref:Major facilitator superfamily domain-containing protein 12 n=1 Tax=Nematostella vectensis TaxID=45351 RepID=A7SNT9_NEMVE|nr:predicted protein [Nematostella vectensis]|eukprot:XP_001626721.1 predicted protein [Nematostella vectensis]